MSTPVPMPMPCAGGEPGAPSRAAVVPGLCAVCHGFGKAPVCTACRTRFGALAPRCAGCAIHFAGAGRCGTCSIAPPPFDDAAARVDYGWPWDDVVAACKFRGSLELAGLLADGIREAVEARAAPRPDLVLPVPLAPARLAERGANQAWEIARRVARGLRLPADAALLGRTRETAHQLDLPPGERAGNVRGAFALDPLRRDAVRGRHVAVVDDVMTTGSTLAEIARVLKRNGAARVSAWVWARTPLPGV